WPTRPTSTPKCRSSRVPSSSTPQSRAIGAADEHARASRALLLPDALEELQDIPAHDLARVRAGVASPEKAFGNVREIARALDALRVLKRQLQRMDHRILALTHHEPVEPFVRLVLGEVETERDVVHAGDLHPVVDHLEEIFERRLVLSREKRREGVRP